MPHGGERDPAQHATPDELLEHLAAYGRVAVCDLPERLRGTALLALAWSRRLIRLEALANASFGFSDGSKIERYEWVDFRRCAFGSTATEALAEDRRRSGKERRLHVVLSEAGERAWAEHAHREQPVQGAGEEVRTREARFATVARALRTLASRASWRLNALPAWIDLGVLRRLDAEGWIEVRAWVLANPTTDFTRPKPRVPAPWGLGWVSPVAEPESMGRWETIWANRCPPETAPEVRVTDRGHAALDALGEETPPPAAGGSPAVSAPGATSTPAPDAWRDRRYTVEQRVKFYMVHCAKGGQTTRPSSVVVAKAIGACAPTVRNTDAWEQWGRLSHTGALSDHRPPDRRRQSDWIARQRMREQEAGDERS